MADYRLGQRVKLHDKSHCADGIGYIRKIKPDGSVFVIDKPIPVDVSKMHWGAWVKPGQFDLHLESCMFKDRNGQGVFVGMRAMSVERDSMNVNRIGAVRDFAKSHRDDGTMMVRISDEAHEARQGHGWSSWVNEADLVVIPDEGGGA